MHQFSKILCFLFFFFPFLTHSSDFLRPAEQLFQEGFFSESLPFYECSNNKSDIYFFNERLFQCYFLEGSFEKAKRVLENKELPLSEKLFFEALLTGQKDFKSALEKTEKIDLFSLSKKKWDYIAAQKAIFASDRQALFLLASTPGLLAPLARTCFFFSLLKEKNPQKNATQKSIFNKSLPCSADPTLIFWDSFLKGQLCRLCQDEESSTHFNKALHAAGLAGKEYEELAQKTLVEEDEPLLAKAYLTRYSIQDYLCLEKKEPFKHLKKMKDKFPNAPSTAVSHYIIGLRYLKDEAEDRLIKKQTYKESIDSFFEAECLAEKLTSSQNDPFLEHLKNESKLERAKALLLAASDSKEGKKALYLDYAEALLLSFDSEPAVLNDPIFFFTTEKHLVETYLLKKDENKALERIDLAIKKVQTLPGNLESYFFLLLFEKGKIYRDLKDFPNALNCYLLAEKKGLGAVDSETKLALFLEISHSFKETKDPHLAMEYLSKVVNAPVISPKRIEAMFLRAELYLLIGKKEQAVKQLEAILLKGGSRSKEAAEKLKQIHLSP